MRVQHDCPRDERYAACAELAERFLRHNKVGFRHSVHSFLTR